MNENIINETRSGIPVLLYQYFSRRINVQHILFLLAFLTFGIGDVVTAAIMMDARGIGGESNMIAAYIYAFHGLAGLIAAKIWFTIFLFGGAILIYWRSRWKSYWMINGFLMSLSIGGIMATMANLQAAAGLPFMSPTEILLIYVGFVLILIEAGDFIDKHHEDSKPDRYPWHNTHFH